MGIGFTARDGSKCAVYFWGAGSDKHVSIWDVTHSKDLWSI
jgi:hypothetical protein